MNKITKGIIGSFLGALPFISTPGFASSHCDHFPEKSENVFIPDFSVQLTSKPYCDHVAFSGMIEGGRRNGRANGTVGFSTSASDLFKISAEFLIQDIKYRFSTGETRHWMHQYAGGIGYQRALRICWLPSLEVTGYLSHAPSRSLSREKCHHFNVHRNIAGANAQGGAAGLTFRPWCSAKIQVDGNYDHVSYQKKFHGNSTASGFGATVRYSQQLFCNWDLNLEGAIRQPFNFWRGAINWHPKSMADQMTVGLFASRTVGMAHLPNNTTAGIQFSYSFGPNCNYSRMKSCSSTSQKTTDQTDKKKNGDPTKNAKKDDCCSAPCLEAWVSSPAVYLPTVLAIADQKKKKIATPTPPPPATPCVPPTTTGIPNFDPNSVSAPIPWTYSILPYFTGDNLTFSIDPFVAQQLATACVLFPPSGVVFDPVAGSFTGQCYNDVATVTVTAQNDCGAVSSTFDIGVP